MSTTTEIRAETSAGVVIRKFSDPAQAWRWFDGTDEQIGGSELFPGSRLITVSTTVTEVRAPLRRRHLKLVGAA